MKKGWEEKFLVKEFSLKSGDNLPAKKQVEGPYPVYGGNGIAGYHNEYNITGDNILIGRVGALCGNIHHTNGNVWVTDNAFVVNKIATYWDINFLTLELKYLKLNQYASQTAQPVISNKSMKDVRLFLPPLSEQKEIVEYLDSSFAKIDKLKENAAKNLEEAKALFQSALKDALEPKEGWEEKTLGEIGEIKVGPFGSLLHKRDYILGGTPLINPMHIINGRIYADDSFTISQNKRDELSSYIMKTDDIIIGRRGEIGRCAVVGITENGYICGTGSMFFRPNKNKINSTYLQLLLSSDFTKKKLEAISGGATMKNLSSTALGKFVTQIPLLSEQQSIVSYLDSLNEKVNTLQQNYSRICDECDALKQAILRQVFE